MYSTLISAGELAQHVADPLWVVFDCRFTLTETEAGRNAYNQAHIPGAVYAHLEEDLSGAITQTSGRHPLPDIESFVNFLSQSGVDKSKQVVVYDDAFGSVAGRLWWMLRWAGHDKVALLDGGLPAWQRDGHEMDQRQPQIQKADFTADVRTELFVSSQDVVEIIEDKSYRVIDARAEERFVGDVEPFDNVAGHVPGAINMPYDDNLAISGGFETKEELANLYMENLGEIKADHVVHMCGSGVTACHNILAMEHAGLTGSRLYVGSWSGWITDPSRPVATGE